MEARGAREAREVREAGKRVSERVHAMGLVNMVKMTGKWQCELQEWTQAVVVGKRGIIVLSGIWMRRGRAIEARQLVAGEAGRLGQAVKGMMYRVMPAFGLGGSDAADPHPRVFMGMRGVMRAVEDRLRSNGPGMWRMMARVRVMGIGRFVEGLARGRELWFIGHWRCVVWGRRAAVRWSGFGKTRNPN